MRYAIFGDIHGNMEALTAVFADMESARVDRALCLGDIVGYGAEPEKCIDELRGRGIASVIGNHDSAVVGDTPLDYFNDYAREAVVWTADRLSGDDKAYLKNLPIIGGDGGFITVHSSLADPTEWRYVINLLAVRRCFDLLTGRLCFIGHSHVPVIFEECGSITGRRASDVHLDKESRYIINVGSVGQPRDGDCRASYGIYDEGEMRFEIRRVSYDIGRAQKKIIEAGLPKSLAFRLGVGR
ncbi:MAG: metallophosphoesterase family protein [bacterium]